MAQISYITESRTGLGMPKIPFRFSDGTADTGFIFRTNSIGIPFGNRIDEDSFFLVRTQILLNRIAAAASFSNLRVKREWGLRWAFIYLEISRFFDDRCRKLYWKDNCKYEKCEKQTFYCVPIQVIIGNNSRQ